MTRPSTVALANLRYTDHIRPGDTIAWPQGPGEPLALTAALVAQGPALHAAGPVTLFFGLSSTPTLRPELGAHFAFRALNGAGSNRRVSALADIVPSHVSMIPGLIRSGAIPIDVMLIHVRPLPGGGYTTGVIADFSGAMIQSARTVIALINPSLPLMGADAYVAPEDIDVLVEGDADAARISDMPDPEPSEVERLVAAQVAALVPDRATIQLGVGTLPAAIGAALMNHRELGVHTGVVSDILVDLVERGVVTDAHKGRDAGRSVTGGLFGTQRLRDYAQASGAVDLRSAEYTHTLAVSASLQKFHTINSAVEIDLTGQVNSEIAGGRYLGAVGGQVDFVRAGVASPGGKSIIAMPSTTPGGQVSKIVVSLDGRPVTTARSDVDVIVTEYGAAHLRGMSLAERARRLIAIAHPDHREALQRAPAGRGAAAADGKPA